MLTSERVSHGLLYVSFYRIAKEVVKLSGGKQDLYE